MESNSRHGGWSDLSFSRVAINHHGSIDWLSPETLVILVLILVFAGLMFAVFWTKIRGGILA